MRIYSPFYPSSYGQGIYSETTVHSSHGYIKLTVVYVSLAENTSKDMLNNVSFWHIIFVGKMYVIMT